MEITAALLSNGLESDVQEGVVELTLTEADGWWLGESMDDVLLEGTEYGLRCLGDDSCGGVAISTTLVVLLRCLPSISGLGIPCHL